MARLNEDIKSVRMKYMFAWLFNISIISLLVILILHFVFEFFGHPAESSMNKLQIQKYKSIIEKMTQETSAAAIMKTAYAEDTGITTYENTDLEEDLELYINSMSEETSNPAI